MRRQRVWMRLALLLALCAGAVPARADLGGWLYDMNRRLEARLAGLEERRLRVDGVDWVYYARDLERGNCEVLVHGFTAEAANWFRFARHLEGDRCRVVPDLPGFGRSGHDDAWSYRIPDQAARLRAFLRAIGARGPYHLVGSSMGGHIVLDYALAWPREVATLALVDAGGVTAPVPGEHMQRLAAGGRSAFDVRSRADFEAMLAMAMHDQPWMPGLVRAHLAQDFIARNARHRAIFHHIYLRDARDARLGEIATPTLVLWGERDRLLHVSMAGVFHRGIRGSRLVVMPDIGHLPFLEAPSATAEHYLAFRRGAVAR